MTLQEYFATPETVLPQELIYGEMRVADAPFVSHQRVVLELAVALRAYIRSHEAGEVLIAPVDVILDPEAALVLQPDVLYVTRERAVIVGDRVAGAPDLVIEVLSPRPRIGRIDERVRWFAQYGVREIWLYHQPGRRLEVLNCDEGRVTSMQVYRGAAPIRSRVLPQWTASVATLLPGPFTA